MMMMPVVIWGRIRIIRVLVRIWIRVRVQVKV
jgi:hypothetical protein